MPIPTLKMKVNRKATEEAESPARKNTMLPRTTRLHVGSGISATPHATSHIPSPQGHREGKQIRPGIATPKMGTRMSGSTGPRPPPRTSSSIRNTQGPKSTMDKVYPPSSIRPPSQLKSGAASKSVIVPGRSPQSNLQPPSYQANVCSSNRSSVISNCSSNPPPSSSSSNRNSSSSIGSTFSVGSWNGGSENGEGQDFSDRHLTTGTFPRAKQIARSKNSDDNIHRATVDKSKLRMPSSYVQNSMNPQLKSRIVGKPLSTSDSSIIGRQRTTVCKPNLSDTNLAAANCMKKSICRSPKNMQKNQCFSPSKIDSDSSDSEDSKNRGFNKHPKGIRDMKYRKENVPVVTQYQQVGSNVPVLFKPESDLKTSDRITSPEDDDGYSSVAITDQSEEDKQYGKISSSHSATVEESVEPMPPLKLMDSYSYFKCISNTSIKSTANCKDINCMEEKQSSTSDQEGDSNKLTANKNVFNSSTFPKNSKYSVKNEPYSVNQVMSGIDESIFGVSYGKLVNSKAELIMKKAESTSRNNRKFGIIEPSMKKSMENTNMQTSYCQYNSQISKESIPHCNKVSASKVNVLPRELDVPIQSETANQFNRAKSLRFPTYKDTKRELFPEAKSNEVSNLNSIPSMKNNSFPRGANKYSTVIPRTPPGQKTRQIQQFTTFVPRCQEEDRKVTQQQCNEAKRDVEDDRTNEILNLKTELKIAKGQINSLAEQLNSKSKLLSAYEHSLTNMTHRLQHLSSLVEQKDIQITELKKMVEKACLDGVCISSNFNAQKVSAPIARGPSMESLMSITSQVSYYSTTSSMLSHDGENKEKKKKSWIRSSINKAFKRKEKKKDNGYDTCSDAESYISHPRPYTRSISEPFKGFSSLPASPVPQRNNYATQEGDQSGSEISDSANMYNEVKVLRQSLREKESALTESRLEALSSAHQIDSLKESIQKLSIEVGALKSNNPSRTEPKSSDSYTTKSCQLIKYKEAVSVSKRVNILIPRSFISDYSNEPNEKESSVNIGQIIVSNNTTWKELFDMVHKSFIEHLTKIDVDNSLGVDIGSIESYKIGDLVSTSSDQTQEFLPYGYFVGHVDWVQINLLNQSENYMDDLAYESLIPKQNLLEFVGALQESRRIVLGGVDGSGKQYLSWKLAEVVIKRLGIQPSSINIAKFQAHRHTSQELSSYLCHINELCEAKRSDLPLAIILEGLNPTEEAVGILTNSLKIPNDQCPYVIATVRVNNSENYDLLSSLSTFRWIYLVSSQGSSERLLQRLCRRDCLTNLNPDSRMITILEWIPRCFRAINNVLESSSVSLIEPGAFLPLPKCLDTMQTWFSNIWKATVLPKIQNAAAEGGYSKTEENLDTWNNLYSCLREDLPWMVVPTGCASNFPITFKTIEAIC